MSLSIPILHTMGSLKDNQQLLANNDVWVITGRTLVSSTRMYQYHVTTVQTLALLFSLILLPLQAYTVFVEE